MSAIAQIAIFPVGAGESLGGYVKDAIVEIEKSGLPCRTGPMGTAIEGEWVDIAAVIGNCLEAMQKHSDRVYCTVAVDWRRGGVGRLDGKIASLEARLGRGVNR